ncbi:hypothetical protein E0M27_24195 [Bacillus mycoides]|nr:hypothetical protein EXW46_21175 [Bacillus mycoides]TBX52459.1 hypothetical protein E0M27_24195 [Bacillus mycoides]
MFPPPFLKIQKFTLYFNYMHVFSVLQYFQFLFFQLYTFFLPLFIPLNLNIFSTPHIYFIKAYVPYKGRLPYVLYIHDQ